MFIIKNMSYSKTLNTKRNDVSKEFMIVQDAYRLDTVGAIGIARTFTIWRKQGTTIVRSY
jgi:HD superfamily phosphodiesterase